MNQERDTIAMQEVYTQRNSEISTGQIFSPEGVPSYIVNLREWANKKVRDYDERTYELPHIKTYKVPGSTGIMSTITTSEKMINCSCPGFTYRRNCKHLSILETSDGLKGVI